MAKYKMNFFGSFTEKKDGTKIDHKFDAGDVIELSVNPGDLGEEVKEKKKPGPKIKVG